MASFVARIADMKDLMDSWADLLADSEGPQVFVANESVFATLEEWPRIRWFYYCDDQNGNTIRLYDTEHFSHFGGGYYLEEDGVGREHRERVIIRGENMWGGKQVDKNGQRFPLNLSCERKTICNMLFTNWLWQQTRSSYCTLSMLLVL